MLQRKDYFLGAFVGFLTSLMALTVLAFAHVSFQYKTLIVITAGPLLFGFGVFLGGVLGRYVRPFFRELGKFSAVGFLSASIDFVVLNVASSITGVTAGLVVGPVNIPGFVLATLNAYFWNKLWVFKTAENRDRLFREAPRFFTVTLVGLIINSAVLIILTTYTAPVGLSSIVWLNLSKVVATFAATLWNFFGYRHLVFASRIESPAVSTDGSSV